MPEQEAETKEAPSESPVPHAGGRGCGAARSGGPSSRLASFSQQRATIKEDIRNFL